MLLLLIACAAEQEGRGEPPTRTDPTVVPDFALRDENPNSPRAGEVVSPRDYLTRVSGWYFIEAT